MTMTENNLITVLQKTRIAQKALSDANALMSEIIAAGTHEEIQRAADEDFDNDAELIALSEIFNSIEDAQKILDKASLATADALIKEKIE